MPLGPVVSSSTLPEGKVVGPKDPPVGSSTNRIHGTRLQVNQDAPGYVLPAGCLIVIDLDPFQLEVGVSVVLS